MHQLPPKLNCYICQDCGQVFYAERKTASLCCPECCSLSYIDEEDIMTTLESGKSYKTAEEMHNEIDNETTNN